MRWLRDHHRVSIAPYGVNKMRMNVPNGAQTMLRQKSVKNRSVTEGSSHNIGSNYLGLYFLNRRIGYYLTHHQQGEFEMKICKRISGAILVMAVSLPVLAGDPVGITPNLMSVTVMHNGAATEMSVIRATPIP